MATREILALNEATPQIMAPQTGDTYVANRQIGVTLGTITAAQQTLDLSATWNNAGVTFNGIFQNITDTTSAAASKVIDLQVGGVTQFNVTKAGLATAAGRFAGVGFTGTGGTVTASTPVLNVTQTWNSAGVTFVGLFANFTTTASNVASRTIDVQIDSQVSFRVTRAGVISYGTPSFVSTLCSPGAFNSDTVLGGSSVTTGIWYLDGSGFVNRVRSTGVYAWTASTDVSASADTGVSRVAAGIVGVGTGATGNGAGALFFSERTAPSAPAADGVYIYAQDNGGGKTQLMALFSSGAAQQIAIQP